MKIPTRYLIILVLCAEFCWSFLADWAVIAMVEKKPLLAVIFSATSMTLSYGILRTIAQRDWGIRYIIAAIVGATLATWIVASR